jgi:hypothetical protein
MVEPSTESTAADESDAPAPGWRFRGRVALIAAGFLSPLGALPDLSNTMKAMLSGLLLAGIPEVFTWRRSP